LLKHQYLQQELQHCARLYAVRYESLVFEPRETALSLLNWLELPWSEAVLRHHETHEGISTGGTDNRRKIDTQSTELWRSELMPRDLEILEQMCGTIALRHGYDITSSGR
jgi:hypothetical protein